MNILEVNQRNAVFVVPENVNGIILVSKTWKAREKEETAFSVSS